MFTALPEGYNSNGNSWRASATDESEDVNETENIQDFNTGNWNIYSFELYEEEAAKNPAWKKIYESWKKFRDDEFLWHRVAERSLSEFLYNNPGGEPAKK